MPAASFHTIACCPSGILSQANPPGLCTPTPLQVLALRQEKAELLGFKNFADVSMASKVRPSKTGCCSQHAPVPTPSPPIIHVHHPCSLWPLPTPPLTPCRWPPWRRRRSCWSSCGAPATTPPRATCRCEGGAAGCACWMRLLAADGYLHITLCGHPFYLPQPRLACRTSRSLRRSRASLRTCSR